MSDLQASTAQRIHKTYADYFFTRFHSQELRASWSSLAIGAVEFEEMDGRRFLELDSEVTGDLAQAVIEMRKVIDSHVANEGAADFVVARAAVQPAQEEKQLKA
jgi:hypothetical protein